MTSVTKVLYFVLKATFFLNIFIVFPTSVFSNISQAENDQGLNSVESNDSVKSSELVVYGQNNCSITREYLRELDSIGISYIYKDLSKQSDNQEFWDMLKSSSYSGSSVDLPVMVHNDKFLIRPSLGLVIGESVAKKYDFSNQTMPIEIYSKPGDSTTDSYTYDLDCLGVKHHFNNINEQETNIRFFEEAKKSGIQGKVKLPAVKIGSKVLVEAKLGKTINTMVEEGIIATFSTPSKTNNQKEDDVANGSALPYTTGNSENIARKLKLEGIELQLKGELLDSIEKYKQSLAIHFNQELSMLVEKLEKIVDNQRNDQETKTIYEDETQSAAQKYFKMDNNDEQKAISKNSPSRKKSIINGNEISPESMKEKSAFFNDWDVVNIKLGMKLEEAQELTKKSSPESRFEYFTSQIGTVRLNFDRGKFRVPGVFSTKIITKTDASEIIKIFHDPLDQEHKAVAITRRVRYSNNKPSIAAVEQAIIEKYGKYDFKSPGKTGLTVFTWVPTMSQDKFLSFKDGYNNGSRDCSSYGLQSGSGIVFYGEGGAGWSGHEVDPACGIILRITMHSRDGIVSSIETLLIDNEEVRRSYDKIGKITKDGEMALIEKEKAIADQNAPKL